MLKDWRSALVFVQPAIKAMLSIENGGLKRRSAMLGHPLAENDRRQDYLRATLADGDDGARIATTFKKQDSSMMVPLAGADCFVVRPPHAPAAKAGEPVDILEIPHGY